MTTRRDVDEAALLAAGATVTRVRADALPAGVVGPLPDGVGERAFQAWVIAVAHAAGYKCAHFRSVRVQRADGSAYWQTPVQADGKGFMDLVMGRESPPKVIAAELKVDGNATSPDQDVWINLFRAAGIPTYVWGPEDAEAIRRILGEP